MTPEQLAKQRKLLLKQRHENSIFAFISLIRKALAKTEFRLTGTTSITYPSRYQLGQFFGVRHGGWIKAIDTTNLHISYSPSNNKLYVTLKD